MFNDPRKQVYAASDADVFTGGLFGGGLNRLVQAGRGLFAGGVAADHPVADAGGGVGGGGGGGGGGGDGRAELALVLVGGGRGGGAGGGGGGGAGGGGGGDDRGGAGGGDRDDDGGGGGGRRGFGGHEDDEEGDIAYEPVHYGRPVRTLTEHTRQHYAAQLVERMDVEEDLLRGGDVDGVLALVTDLDDTPARYSSRDFHYDETHIKLFTVASTDNVVEVMCMCLFCCRLCCRHSLAYVSHPHPRSFPVHHITCLSLCCSVGSKTTHHLVHSFVVCYACLLINSWRTTTPKRFKTFIKFAATCRFGSAPCATRPSSVGLPSTRHMEASCPLTRFHWDSRGLPVSSAWQHLLPMVLRGTPTNVFL